jgi:hypothetical protein
MNHPGPGQAYLAKTPDGVTVKDFSGIDGDWFKIASFGAATPDDWVLHGWTQMVGLRHCHLDHSLMTHVIGKHYHSSKDSTGRVPPSIRAILEKSLSKYDAVVPQLRADQWQVPLCISHASRSNAMRIH